MLGASSWQPAGLWRTAMKSPLRRFFANFPGDSLKTPLSRDSRGLRPSRRRSSVASASSCSATGPSSSESAKASRKSSMSRLLDRQNESSRRRRNVS
eukprot:scaffold2945_cov244-Pinguiococcus_pyrenoidosus.AAC.3